MDFKEVMKFVMEKKEVWIAMGDFWGQFIEKMKVWIAKGDFWGQFMEKMKVWIAKGGFWGQFMEKMKEVWIAQGDFWGQFMEKMKEVWIAKGDFWGQWMDWFEKVFPAETREKIHHWLALALLILIAGAGLITLCYWCCCSSRGGRGLGKMMKAPGRNITIPRRVFESSPRLYFRNLRAFPGDKLC